jgi:poly-beta-1,6-N-acetyl-D-glucosamine synthase
VLIFLGIILILFLLYASLVLWFWHLWRSLPEFKTALPEHLFISVIIPARNEEKNIGRLLDSLQIQQFPPGNIEVIVIDDHSTDDTAAIVKQYAAVRLLQSTETGINSFKKKAIESGIQKATHPWIVCTDADCTASPRWLNTLSSFTSQNGSVFLAAPVFMECNGSLLQRFQQMDFMMLQAITGAVVNKGMMPMSNGANIMYNKNIYSELKGFKDIDHIASGDDMLLMNKFLTAHPGKVHYVKSPDAIVNTLPMKSWKEFFNQRIRWASKARNYRDAGIFSVLLVVYLFNLSFLVLLAVSAYYPVYWKWLLALLLGKTIAELPLFLSAYHFFGRKGKALVFFLFQPIHILYTIFAGLLGQLGKYEWKGRKVR